MTLIQARPDTTVLVRFLIARLDEEDDDLRRETRVVARSPLPHGVERIDLEHRRVDCMTRRRIIGTAQHLLVLRDQPLEKPVRDAATQILLALSAQYADRTGYRDEWRLPPHL